ncbi:Transposon Ty3-G Gag-Pol polyprotein [Araneus ventricosus]|uniref:RNA-directed DNA polymerase n=2 Tax=Araneus ventricosus TaxID=182803 RepID=A0A4Y2D0S2_ARAVE|nr:Transposon Ty3-G Gag-Pol polyprotein [Araneus ventricosus]
MTNVQGIVVQQTRGTISLTKTCTFSLKIGTINKNVTVYVLDHTLPYIILGMPELSKYDITIDCSKQKICQNGKNLNKSQNDKSHSNDKDKQNVSLHISECKQINSHCSQTTEDQVNPPQSVTENKCELRKEVKDIIKNFDSVFSKDKYDVGALRVEPQRIVLNSDLPVSLRSYHTSPVEEEEIKSQVEKLLQAGLIKESNNPYSSPVTLAFKRDESKKTRLCIDFRKLNALCKSDSEPLPLMDSLLDKLSKAKIFSSLDLASGYWHVPIHPKDTEKLAFCTNFGLYEWCRLPFGIKVAPAIFNRLIRRILTKYKIDFACNYFDDIIVYSSSELEHWKHLNTIFEICEKENIKLKLSKCVFAQTKISFLGYEIEQGKVSPNNANIETIKKLQPPTNVKELQRFLGSVNVYNKFIPQYAKLRYPLNQLLKKDVKFNWTNECQDAFDKLKETLTTKPVLNLYNPDVTCHVFVDASQKSVGAVLKQPDASDVLHPIAYHSRTLRDYEKNYAITELECLAIVDALDKFYYYLHVQKFVIHTDHAALVWLKNVKNLRAHHPQTNGKVERVNQSLVTRLKYKVNSTSTKVPWTKLLESVTNEYNLTPHSITKYPPAYLLLGTLPYDSPIGQNSYYEPVNEARNLALQRTIDYHNKNKIRYDARFVDKKFNPGDLVVYEEFHYPNTRKLSPPFSGPSEVIKQCSEVTYEINKSNPLTKQATQIVHISKLRCFHSPDKLKLSHE